MADLWQFRRDTAANWTAANPVLAEGELGLETGTKQFKIGDGTTAWNGLVYANPAQVNADWNAASGAAKILNKPTIPTLTFPVRTINSQSGTTYTTVLADGNSATAPGTIIQANNAAALTHTIPTNASVPYEVGAELYFTQTGAGQLTLTGASGVTLNTGSSLKTRAQGSTIGLYKSDTDTWYTFGDLA